MGDLIRPRRGTKTTMHETEKSVIVLKEGELFFEFPDEGVGKGSAKIKIGDGVSAYVALPYALGNDFEERPIDYLEDHRDDYDEVIEDFKPGITINVLSALTKRCIQLLDLAIHALEYKLDTNFYTKNEVYNKEESYNKAEVYNKGEIDLKVYDKTDVYTKTESDARYYQKTEVYTKEEISQILLDYYKKSETYTKQEVEDLVLIDVVSTDPSNPKVGQQWIKT